jgi:hypothetical protein
LLAAASVALAEGAAEDAQRLIGEASALIEPTDYRDLRERARRMSDLAAARSKAS